MKLNLALLAAGVSSYLITGNHDAQLENIKESKKLVEASFKNTQAELYQLAHQNVDDVRELLDIQGGQHAFDLEFLNHGEKAGSFKHSQIHGSEGSRGPPHERHDGPDGHRGPPHERHDGPDGHRGPPPPPPHGGREGPKKPPHKNPDHPPHDGPDHPPHRENPHDQRDKSIYEFIAESEYFTILHDIIKGDEKAVKELNKTSANLTLFAPTDRALKKYKDHAPPVEVLRKVLLYHILPEVFPAGKVLASKTLPTLYFEKELDTYQRLAVDINPRGLTLNYYARIIYIDVFTNNGVIHAVDNLLFPVPEIYEIAEVLPSTFSTFVNALWKTGLVDAINETSHSTVFAPTNFGFSKLGPRINMYLFSKRGQPVLTKLLKYHVVPDVLFYTDVEKPIYKKKDVSEAGLARHYEFQTLSEDKSIYVDITEFGRFKALVYNGRRISTSDIPAKNGVLQKLDGVILPYKKDLDVENIHEMSIDDFEALFEESEGEDQVFTILPCHKTRIQDSVIHVEGLLVNQLSEIDEDIRDFFASDF